MKKLINGKVTEIRKIELFEMALAGLALGAKAVSNTENTMNRDTDNEAVSKIIKLYNSFYTSMPYPLYAIEDDIKYSALGTFIKHTESGSNQIMFIDKGLYIVIDLRNMLAIHIVNNSWSIESIDSIKKDNVNIDNYKDNIAYEEYNWVLNTVLKLDKHANYYSKFMPEFVKACNGDAIIMRWELQNMMNFCSIPDRINLVDNVILDTESGNSYSLSIYKSGRVSNGNTNTRWTIGLQTRQEEYKETITRYDYNLYQINGDNGQRVKKCNTEWAASLFSTLYRIKSICNSSEFGKYTAVICCGTIVYEVYGVIYAGNKNGNSEIANNSEIYAVHSNDVYFRRITKCDSIYKIGIYKYNIADRKVSTCSIMYSSNRDEI